jgi:hypothetical protein
VDVVNHLCFTLIQSPNLYINLLWSPGIDSQPGGPVRQPYLTYRPARLHRLSESIPGLLERLQIQAIERPRKKMTLPSSEA